jgi:flagellar biosynthesis protein FlhF
MKKIRKFSAQSIPEALKMVRDEMGSDAVILGTTRLPGQKGRRHQVEVVAASDGNPGRSSATDMKRRAQGMDHHDSHIAELRKTDKNLVLELRQIESRLRTLLDKVLGPGAGADRPVTDTPGKTLLDAGFDSHLVEKRLSAHRHAMETSTETLVEDLVGRVRVAPALERISVFLGTSGAGKTTTVLKVASQVLLPNGLKPQVVYFGEDDGRGVSWLRNQCRRIRVRFKKVPNIKNLDKILRKARKHPILIDTPGISELGDEDLRFIAEAARVYEGMRIRLVVDSGMDPQNICSIASCIPDSSRMSLVLTKLDEATRIGGAISMAIDTRTPLAYVTGGKDPDGGIYAADAALLSEKVLESLREIRAY